MFTVEEFLVIRDLHHQGLNISQISRETGYHRNTVRKYLAAQTMPIPVSRRPRPSKLDPYKAYIQQRIRDHPRVTFTEGSITDLDLLTEVFPGTAGIFHQAAIPSVPRSVKDPLASNEANVTGTL